MGLVVDKEVPLNFFENEQWKKYMGEELKKLGVSTNRDAIKTMLAEREKKRQKNLTNIMKNKSMFLKIDSCKRHLTKYFAVSAQFFDSMDMKVHYFTLGISEITETSVNLKHLVEKSMKKFEIHHKQVIAVVSNNAANIIEAVQQLSRADVELAMEEEDDNTLESLFLIEHVRCAAHTLQLAIRDGLRTCGFAIVIAEIRDICKSSRSSGIASDWRNMGQPPLSVDMATRWGSTFVMIDGAIKAKNTIQTLEARHPELYMNEEKWAQLVVVRDALEPAYATTKAIQSLSLSPGEFFYKWKLLEHTLTRLNSVVSQRIAEEMTARASQLFENDVLLAGIYIDLKSRDLLSTEEQQRGKTCFIDLALHLHLTAAPSQPSASSSTPGETSSQRSTSSPTLSDETQSPLVEPCAQESFEEQLNVKAQERINQKQQHDRMELIQYKRMITQQIEVLETQDRNKGLIESISEYPPVLQQACLVTSAMPTTSVSVERLFWYVKFIKSDKRPDLDEESLNGLVFLKTNGID